MTYPKLEDGVELLNSNGLSRKHYIMSYRGPTVILTEAGQKLITPEIRSKLDEIGFKILG